jgi:hypothetical protein
MVQRWLEVAQCRCAGLIVYSRAASCSADNHPNVGTSFYVPNCISVGGKHLDLELPVENVFEQERFWLRDTML